MGGGGGAFGADVYPAGGRVPGLVGSFQAQAGGLVEAGTGHNEPDADWLRYRVAESDERGIDCLTPVRMTAGIIRPAAALEGLPPHPGPLP